MYDINWIKLWVVVWTTHILLLGMAASEFKHCDPDQTWHLLNKSNYVTVFCLSLSRFSNCPHFQCWMLLFMTLLKPLINSIRWAFVRPATILYIAVSSTFRNVRYQHQTFFIFNHPQAEYYICWISSVTTQTLLAERKLGSCLLRCSMIN